MNRATTTIFGVVIAAGALLLSLAGCGEEKAAGPAGPTAAMPPPATPLTCSGTVDYVIKVNFSTTAPHCPQSVEPPAAALCNNADPQCTRVAKKTGGHPTVIHWESDPPGVSFGVFFDPLVGPPHVSMNGCVKGIIAGGNSDQLPPVDPTTTEVRYKYTIATMKSPTLPDDTCMPLDPPVIIEH